MKSMSASSEEKEYVASQSAQILKEGLARGQSGPDQHVKFVAVAQEAVEEDGQDVEAHRSKRAKSCSIAWVAIGRRIL